MADHYFPDDILTLILIRLPPKTILKFLTVSKSWYSLLTNPNFISSHLHHHNHRNNHHKTTNQLLFVLESKFHHSICQAQNLNNKTHLTSPKPSSNNTHFTSILGSCNGVVCLFNLSDKSLCLWNPFLNKSLNLDPTPVGPHPRNHHFSVLGFGFDSWSNDFKVVLLDLSNPLPHGHIYSLNSRVWKSLDCSRFCFDDDDLSYVSEGCFVSGVIHWVLFCDPEPFDHLGFEYASSILTFHVGYESFGYLGLPPGLGDVCDPDLSLAVIDDSLGLLHLLGQEYGYVVWRMREYGVEESWMILYRIKLNWLHYPSSGLNANGGGGGLIVTSSGSLITFDEESSSSSRKVDGSIVYMAGQAFTYMQSLALLHNFSEPSWMKRESRVEGCDELEGTE